MAIIGLFSALGSVVGNIVAPGIGGSIGGSLGGLVDGSNASSANRNAVNGASAAQIAQLQNANSAIYGELGNTTRDLNPYIAQGHQAITGLSDLAGLNGGAAQQTSISGLQNSPLYQSLFNTGQNSVLGAAAATGGLRGGNVNSALYNNGQQTLAQVIQQQLGLLGGIEGQGLSAANSLGQFGAQATAQSGNLLTGVGNAQAGGILGNQAINNANTTGNNSLYNSLGTSLTGLLGSGSGGLSGILGGFSPISDSAANGGITGALGNGVSAAGSALQGLSF